jgi:proteasome lid subunit RPN8/RPN11
MQDNLPSNGHRSHHNILLTTSQLQELATLSEAQAPNESVALLVGKQYRIVEIVAVHNQDESSISFSIDPQELLKQYAEVEKKGLEIIGIFHSHPGPPDPSTTDLKYMQLNPVVWLIYSSTQKKFKAHVIDDNEGLLDAKIQIV